MSTPDYDVIAAEIHRKALENIDQRDGDHADAHLGLADRLRGPRTSRPA